MCLTGQLLQQSHELLILETSGSGRLVMSFLSLLLPPLWRIRGRKAFWRAPRPRVFLTFALNICQPSLGVIGGDFVGERQAFTPSSSAPLKTGTGDVAINIGEWRSSEKKTRQSGAISRRGDRPSCRCCLLLSRRTGAEQQMLFSRGEVPKFYRLSWTGK